MLAVEAAAAGKAVSGTRISDLKDTVRHGETGLLVEAGGKRRWRRGCLSSSTTTESGGVWESSRGNGRSVSTGTGSPQQVTHGRRRGPHQ